MQSNTSKFSQKLKEILDNLEPHIRECEWKDKHSHCENKFKITKEDIEFLNLLKVPPPNFCPTCRRMRRLVFMGSNRFFKP